MGERFGNYELVRRIAQGGMAEVFLARFTGVEGFERWVVIKRMLPELAVRNDFVEMFLDEARLAARFNHPNIVQVHELGERSGAYFMAMEYVDGPHLGALFAHSLRKKVPLPVNLCCFIVARAAEGLHHAHEMKDGKTGTPLNIVHRDVSPQNILVAREGDVKVMDFGVAKAASQSTQTRTGVVKGKVGYMSPEQCLANPVDRRTDVFALGIVLYELVTRRRLFRDKSDLVVMQKITTEDVPPPSSVNPRVPPELDEVLLRALRRDMKARTPDALTLSDELDAFLAGTGEATTRNTMARWMTDNAADMAQGGETAAANPTPSWSGSQSPSGGSQAGPVAGGGARSNPDAATRALEAGSLNEGTLAESEGDRADPAVAQPQGTSAPALALPPNTSPDAGRGRLPVMIGAFAGMFVLALGGVWMATRAPERNGTGSSSSGSAPAGSSSGAVAASLGPAPASTAAPQVPDTTLGALRILTEPAQAEVSVNKVVRGTCESGPLLVDKLPLDPAGATVVVTLDGYDTQKLSVPLQGGETTTLPVIKLRKATVTAKPTMGVFEIQSDPSNARVIIDGKPMGRTPLMKVELREGQHPLVVEGPPGYETVRESIKSVAGVKQGLRYSLEKAARPEPTPRQKEPEGNGKLYIDSAPWTYVYLGGKNLGPTPIPTIEVPAGRVNVRLKRDGKDGCTIDVGRTVEVQANQLTRKVFTLEAREQKGTCQ